MRRAQRVRRLRQFPKHERVWMAQPAFNNRLIEQIERKEFQNMPGEIDQTEWIVVEREGQFRRHAQAD